LTSLAFSGELEEEEEVSFNIDQPRDEDDEACSDKVSRIVRRQSPLI
jgi:hypothetical protein